MNPTHLIYHAAHFPPIENVEKVNSRCMVCGCKMKEGTSYKKVVSDAFTNWDLMEDLAGTHVCKACTWCIRNPQLRRSSWIAIKEDILFFKRDLIEKHLFNPPEPPFVFFVTASYKKHGSFRAKVNDSKRQFYVQFEDQRILFSPTRYQDLYDLMNKMYQTFNKTEEIGKGLYIQKRVQAYGVETWRQDEEVLRQFRGSQVFELLCYALNKPEEVKIVNRMRTQGRRAKIRRP